MMVNATRTRAPRLHVQNIELSVTAYRNTSEMTSPTAYFTLTVSLYNADALPARRTRRQSATRLALHFTLRPPAVTVPTSVRSLTRPTYRALPAVNVI